MKRRRTRSERLDGVALCGTLLVAALVVAVPLAMALCPADALGGSGASGVGAGTGDVIAAALSGFDRDLHGAGMLPAPERNHDPVFPAAAAFPASDARAHAFDATAPPRLGARASTPGDARSGPTDLGHQLLL